MPDLCTFIGYRETRMHNVQDRQNSVSQFVDEYKASDFLAKPCTARSCSLRCAEPALMQCQYICGSVLCSVFYPLGFVHARGNVHFTIIEMIHLDEVGGAVFDCSADICSICRPPPDGGCLSFEKAAKIVCQGAPDHAFAHAAACWRLRRRLVLRAAGPPSALRPPRLRPRSRAQA